MPRIVNNLMRRLFKGVLFLGCIYFFLAALAGVVIGGRHTSEIFIENGRFHGKQIVNAVTGKSAAKA